MHRFQHLFFISIMSCICDIFFLHLLLLSPIESVHSVFKQLETGRRSRGMHQVHWIAGAHIFEFNENTTKKTKSEHAIIKFLFQQLFISWNNHDSLINHERNSVNIEYVHKNQSSRSAKWNKNIHEICQYVLNIIYSKHKKNLISILFFKLLTLWNFK